MRPPPTQHTANSRQATGYRGRAYILLAEGFEVDLEAVGVMLDRLGHRHDTAFDGQDVLAKIDHSLSTGELYDLVLIDVRMARIDGLEATRRLRAYGPSASTPIVGLAADVFAGDVAAGMAAGMDLVLPKPVRIEELRAAIDIALAGSAARPGAPGGDRACPPPGNLTAHYAERRAEMLGRINALVGGGDFAPEILEEVVELAHKLAGSAGMAGDPVACDLAYALEECVRGFAACGEGAIREAAAALQ